MNETEILVLRFRDIERALGETIRTHRRVIETSGATWWGWLFRSFEHIPDNYLRSLGEDMRLAKNGGDNLVYLYDTGQTRVYRACCVDIHATSYPERSPDTHLTPAYYSDRPAPAWFKFVDISDAPADELLGSICTAMPSATDECAIDLLGSTVRELKELRKQEVTMWVLDTAPYSEQV